MRHGLMYEDRFVILRMRGTWIDWLAVGPYGSVSLLCQRVVKAGYERRYKLKQSVRCTT
jgi:hypothetical protein